MLQASRRPCIPSSLHRCQLQPLSHLVRICLLSMRAPVLAPRGERCLQTHFQWQPSLGASLELMLLIGCVLHALKANERLSWSL